MLFDTPDPQKYIFLKRRVDDFPYYVAPMCVFHEPATFVLPGTNSSHRKRVTNRAPSLVFSPRKCKIQFPNHTIARFCAPKKLQDSAYKPYQSNWLYHTHPENYRIQLANPISWFDPVHDEHCNNYQGLGVAPNPVNSDDKIMAWRAP